MEAVGRGAGLRHASTHLPLPASSPRLGARLPPCLRVQLLSPARGDTVLRFLREWQSSSSSSSSPSPSPSFYSLGSKVKPVGETECQFAILSFNFRLRTPLGCWIRSQRMPSSHTHAFSWRGGGRQVSGSLLSLRKSIRCMFAPHKPHCSPLSRDK